MPQQPEHDGFESTVQQMQTVTMTEVEEAYWEWLERLKRQRAVLAGIDDKRVQFFFSEEKIMLAFINLLNCFR